ncbi:glycosyl transferase family 4 [Candidatus Pacearchaeota archaeon]|nr:glycosyl transferase family 4 [Candidatus Pacearchaeota archaeon]
MITYILTLPIIVSFLITLFFLPSWISRAKNAGLTGKDMNKFSRDKVAEAGGVIVIAGFIFSSLLYVAIKTFYFKSQANVVEIFALLTLILIIAFIGIIDDILGWKIGLGKKVRLFLVFFAAVPLVVINVGESIISIPFLDGLNLGIIYPLLIIPLGIMGASTTFNFLAGYNGLEARQGILILSALSLASFLTGTTWLSLILLCMVAALCGFLLFNSFPAKVFPGDTMTYSLGAIIAAAAILGNLERFSIFIFIPYIIEVFLKLRGKLKMESFALPQKDNSLDLKYNKIYGLEHLAIFILKKYKQKVYEKDVVNFINLFQLIVIILAFIIFREGIFI